MRRSITRNSSSSSSSSSSSLTSSIDSSSNYQTPTPLPPLIISSSSSSSSDHHQLYLTSSSSVSNRIMKLSSDLSTDLSLGLGISTTTFHTPSLFVKVKMEGIRIGRKVDLLAHADYPPLINTLEHMFSAPNILWAEGEQCPHHRYTHVLTYEDQEGDWMMVGDVPWEMFLTTVKRLKITRTDTSSF